MVNKNLVKNNIDMHEKILLIKEIEKNNSIEEIAKNYKDIILKLDIKTN